MRITAYVAVSGERTLTRFLQPDMAQIGDVSPDGKFDEIQARKALADIPGIVPSADDSTPVYAFALQFIDYAHKMLAQLADKGDNGDTPQNRADERCVKRMDGGKCAFARVDVNGAPITFASGSRARIRTGSSGRSTIRFARRASSLPTSSRRSRRISQTATSFASSRDHAARAALRRRGKRRSRVSCGTRARSANGGTAAIVRRPT